MMHVMIKFFLKIFNRTPLHDCAERGFCDIAKDLLAHEADINAQNWILI